MMPLVLDCVPYFNESDIWRLRYETLRDVVDGFVVVEARHTHSGQPKDTTFEMPEDARPGTVTRRVVSLPDPGMPGVPATRRREMFQRNAITEAVVLEHWDDLPDDTILLISDCDEIPNPAVVATLKQRGLQDGEIVIFQQSFFYYNLNTRASQLWTGTRAARWADVRALSPHVVRYGLGGTGDGLYPRYLGAPNAGWHLSYFGGPEQVKRKMGAFLHQELVTAENTDPATIAARIQSGADIWGRPDNGHGFSLGPALDVPPPVAADPRRWRHFFHPDYAPKGAGHE